MKIRPVRSECFIRPDEKTAEAKSRWDLRSSGILRNV